jgi:ABC-type hemin transport system ATPase subunit
MDGSFVYSKTPKGVAEIAARSAQIAMSARRVLIMIDGKRTVDEVSVLVRPGEINSIIAQLESGGFIQRASGSLDVPTVNGRETEFGVAADPIPAGSTSETG